MKAFKHPSVKVVFNQYPKQVREKILWLRELIFQVAIGIPEVGKIEETLKWGQPSYLTSESKSGTTIRIDAISSQPGSYGLFVHCQTSLIETFRNKFGNTFQYDGNRALVFNETEAIPEDELRECISLALTYHLKKRGKRMPIGQQINENRS